MLKAFTALLLLLCFTTGCAQQATFLSAPIGARVLVDGQEVGVTPCAFPYSNGIGGSYEVRVEKEGYEALSHRLAASDVDKKARKRWLAAGLVWSPLWLGTFFTKKLEDSYEFVLKKAAPAMTAQAGQNTDGGSF